MFAERDREDAAVRLALCVDQHVFTETAANLAGRNRVGDDAAERGVDLLGRAVERSVGEDGNDERSGADAKRRIVTKTNLHGGPFGW